MNRAVTALLGCGLAVGAAAAPARAHDRSLSYSSWKLLPDGAQVRLRMPRLELTRLPPEVLAASPGASYFSERLELLAGDRPCPATRSPRPLSAPPGWVVYEWRVRCHPDGPRVIRSSLLREVSSSHLHFARLRLRDGAVLERVLSETEPRWGLAADSPQSPRAGGGSRLVDYLRLGVEHILTGWDHLAFVVALLLLARTFGEVATLVTAFTVAHSVTLGLAVLGVVRPEAAAVEALIGFSIALVAAENAWLLAGRDRLVPALATAGLLALALLAAAGVGTLAPLALIGLALFSLCHFGLLARAGRPALLRALVAFVFGLVHGFGFAGVLAEMELPSRRLAPALFGFNAGVELGQLGIVAAIWPAFALLARAADGRWQHAVAASGSAAICGLGLFWFVTRALG